MSDDLPDTTTTAYAATDPGGPLEPWAEPPEGEIVGRFELVQRCARGGCGVVYRAVDLESGARVAVKIPRWHPQRSERFSRRLLSEVEAVCRFEHPNVVALLDHGTWADDRPFYAMEWLEGNTVRDELRTRGPMSVPEAMYVLERVAGALEAVHAAGIVHRDLKASNVMLVPRPEGNDVKLLDFGLAKLFDTTTGKSIHVTVTGEVLGTPQIMSPEQIRGERVDHRADIYAFGVLVHHLLTGKYPFWARTFAELRSMHLLDPPPDVSERAPVPAALDAVVRRCLAKAPADRYPSIDAAIEALRAVAAGGDLSRFESLTTLGIGIHLTVELDDAADDDAAFDALDAVLQAAHDGLVDAGLDVAMESGRGILAVAPLASDGGAARAERDRLVRRVRELAASHEQTAPHRTRARSQFTVHVATLTTSHASGKREYIGGALLHVDEWPVDRRHARVIVTDEARLL